MDHGIYAAAEINDTRMHPSCAIVRVAQFAVPRPTLFLDRDGVLIEERHYLSEPEGVALIPGAIEALKAARHYNMAIIVITNQAGIGHGFYSFEDYLSVEAKIENELAREGLAVDATFACPYHPDGKGPFRRHHPWRKPEPGMLLAAASRLNLDLPKSVIFGDRVSDLLAGARAGLRSGFLVRTGYGQEETSLLSTTDLGTMRAVCTASIADFPKLAMDLAITQIS